MQTPRVVARTAASAALVAAVLVASTGAASAAGSGYGGIASAPGGAGAFSIVVSVLTVPVTGGSFTAEVDGSTIVVNVPAGDFPYPVQLVFSSGDLTALGNGGIGGIGITAFGVQFDHDGVKINGAYPKPVRVSVDNSAITASSVVYIDIDGSFAPAGFTTSTGLANGAVYSDPEFLIDTPVTASTPLGNAIPGATTAATGKPFVTEEAGALALLGVSAFGGLRWRRQRRAAT